MNRNDHPSNRLSSGTVTHFEEALVLVEAEHRYERDLVLRSFEDPDQANVERMDTALAQTLMATRHAGRIWREEQEAARLRTIDRLRLDMLAAEAALDDEAARWLGLLADALEKRDYSGLAI